MATVTRIELPTPFAVGTVNVWLVRGDACVLVDAGLKTDEARAALLHGLNKAGVALKNIDAVLVTHGHVDHFGLARWLRDEGDSRIHGHEDEQDYIETFPAMHLNVMNRFRETSREHGYPEEEYEETVRHYAGSRQLADASPLDVVLKDGDEIRFGDLSFRAIHTPGHTGGSVCYRFGDDLFCGDTILERITPITFFKGVRKKTGPGYYRKSLERLAELDVGKAYPGHKRAFENFGEVVARIGRHLDIRKERILGALDEPRTAHEIAREAFPAKVFTDRWLAFAQTIGVLEDLADQGALLRLPGSPVRFAPP